MNGRETQYKKILEMCGDGEWYCQNDFRRLYVFSPHKRRMEIAVKFGFPETKEGYKQVWDERPCIHGVRNQKDYLLKINWVIYWRQRKVPEQVPLRWEVITVDRKEIARIPTTSAQ